MRVESITKAHTTVTTASLSVFFTLLMILSAFVRIPLFFTPVPLTMQTLVLYLSLVVLRQKASFSQILYLILGTAGLPVFTNAGTGLLYLSGPTGGYLIGFVMAAVIVGRYLPEKLTFFKSIVFFSLAALLVYLCGIIWLAGIHHFSLWQAFLAGLMPFMPAEVMKILFASLFAAGYRNK